MATEYDEARSIRMTDQLWDRLEVAAAQCGVSRARYVRIVLTNHMEVNGLGVVKGRPPKDGYKVIKNLRGSDID